MSLLAEFHFLRPACLLVLLPAAGLVWRLRKAADPTSAWRGVIAPHLLEALALTSADEPGRLPPITLLAVALAVAIVALAGPAWERSPAPFAEDQAAVVLVVKVTPSMLAEDVPPNRLQRAVQKIEDLLALRAGQRTALVAYAGSAHLAMPLTDDADIIRTFAAALEPGAMPVEGDEPAAAVRLANERLTRAGVPGSIVLLTDALPEDAVADLAALRQAGAAPVHILAIAGDADVIPPPGSPPALPLDENRLRAAARAAGGAYYRVTPDPADVMALSRDIERGIRNVSEGDQEAWRDMGYWLLPLLAVLLLLFFRPGGSVVTDP